MIERFPSSADRKGCSDDTSVDLGAPLSVSGSAPYLRGCHSLGISENDVISRLTPSKRSFSFGDTILNLLGVAPGFFVADDGRVATFSRDIIQSNKIPSLLGLATMREMEDVIDVGNKTLSSACGWTAQVSSKKWPTVLQRAAR